MHTVLMPSPISLTFVLRNYLPGYVPIHHIPELRYGPCIPYLQPWCTIGTSVQYLPGFLVIPVGEITRCWVRALGRPQYITLRLRVRLLQTPILETQVLGVHYVRTWIRWLSFGRDGPYLPRYRYGIPVHKIPGVCLHDRGDYVNTLTKFFRYA